MCLKFLLVKLFYNNMYIIMILKCGIFREIIILIIIVFVIIYLYLNVIESYMIWIKNDSILLENIIEFLVCLL